MKTFIQAAQMGKYVQECLAHSASGKVAGVTSKGIFFLFGRYSVFLTRSQAASPFNISIPAEASIPETLQPGDEVFYSLGDLLIPERSVTVSLAQAKIWTPPAPRIPLNSPEERLERSKTIIRHIRAFGPEKGFIYLTNDISALSPSEMAVLEAARQISRAYASQDEEDLLNGADKLFGLGSGLTPSGDDLVTGFLLLHTRLDDRSRENGDFLGKLCRQLTDKAYQRTTWISANRLEAACRGWSEGMFLDTIDVISGNAHGREVEIAHSLYDFGHSSGVDTFMGIALALGAIT